MVLHCLTGRYHRAIDQVAAWATLDAAEQKRRLQAVVGHDSGGADESRLPESVAVALEMVLTVRAGRRASLAWLWARRPKPTLSGTARATLEAAFRLYLQEGGDISSATGLSDAVAIAFGDFESLDRFAPSAQAVLLGFAWRNDAPLLKSYINTRLGAGEHRATISALGARFGVDALPVYEQLFEKNPEAVFKGVGIDLSPRDPARLKLYTRLPRRSLEAAISSICGSTMLGSESSVALAKEEANSFLGVLEPVRTLADDIELAVAIGTSPVSPMPSLKLTVFFVGGAGDFEAVNAVGEVVAARCGARDLPLPKLVASLEPDSSVSALHGVGIEIGDDARDKVNVYLRAR